MTKYPIVMFMIALFTMTSCSVEVADYNEQNLVSPMNLYQIENEIYYYFPFYFSGENNLIDLKKYNCSTQEKKTVLSDTGGKKFDIHKNDLFISDRLLMYKYNLKKIAENDILYSQNDHSNNYFDYIRFYDGYLYEFDSMQGVIYKFDGEDKIELRDSVVSMSIYDNELFYSDDFGNLNCINLINGEEKRILSLDNILFQTNIDDLSISNIIKYGDKLYFLVNDINIYSGKIYCYDLYSNDVVIYKEKEILTDQFQIYNDDIYYYGVLNTENDRKRAIYKFELDNNSISVVYVGCSPFCIANNRLFFYEYSKDGKKCIFCSVDLNGENKEIIDSN